MNAIRKLKRKSKKREEQPTNEDQETLLINPTDSWKIDVGDICLDISNITIPPAQREDHTYHYIISLEVKSDDERTIQKNMRIRSCLRLNQMGHLLKAANVTSIGDVSLSEEYLLNCTYIINFGKRVKITIYEL
jgi:hypothetical protein